MFARTIGQNRSWIWLILSLSACDPPAPQNALRAPELPPVPPLPASDDDPPTADRIALGAALFYDARLSGSGHTSCNACHLDKIAFQDNLIKSIPDRSYPSDRPTLERNTPSLYNLVYAPVFRWDGSDRDLASVMTFPFAEANMNLGYTIPDAQAQLKQRLTVDVPGYVPLFQRAYAEDLRALDDNAVWRLAGRALAAYLRRAVSRDSAFDRWNAGDDAAMSPGAVRGLAVFRTRGKCVVCHNGPFFSDFDFHNLSTSVPDKGGHREDEGRYLVTQQESDRGAFLTPTLRGVWDTGPYFHDGSAPGLRAVLRHKSSAAVTADPNRDALFREPLALSDGDIDDLLEFMRALRGEPVPVMAPPPLP